MGKKLLALPFILMTTLGYAGEASQALNQVKQNVIQNAYSYGDTAIESWAKDNLSSLRLIEIETRASEDSKPTFRAISLFEITG
jgi:hypothetical protein